jgi:glutamine synthetase
MEDNVGKVIQEIERCGIKFVRLQFVDIHGTPKNMAVPLAKPDDFEEILKNGLLFDGSSVAGFVNINDSDLIIKPDPDTFSPLPWRPEIYMRHLPARWNPLRRGPALHIKKNPGKSRKKRLRVQCGT